MFFLLLSFPPNQGSLEYTPMQRVFRVHGRAWILQRLHLHRHLPIACTVCSTLHLARCTGLYKQFYLLRSSHDVRRLLEMPVVI
jgi:hypothetical protein